MSSRPVSCHSGHSLPPRIRAATAWPNGYNRTLGVLSKMFNLAELWGLRPDGSNPCLHVKRYKEKKRERFLSVEEFQRLGRVLDEILEDGSESATVQLPNLPLHRITDHRGRVLLL